MRLRSTIISIFSLFSFYISAQDNQSLDDIPSFYFNILDNCGGRKISAWLYNNNLKQGNSIYGEENKFYIEISVKGAKKYEKITNYKIDIGDNTAGLFELPDTLRPGQSYLIRMGSSHPQLLSENKEFVFAPDLLPFEVDFNQEVSYTSSKVPLNLAIKFPSKINYQKFNITLNDNSKIEKFIFGDSEISVLPPKDNYIYKIDEILNSCGVEGKINGDAKTIKVDTLFDLVIKNSEVLKKKSNYCNVEKLSFDVFSKSIKKETKFQLQFTSTYDFSNLSYTQEVVFANNKIIADLPEKFRNKFFYARIITENPKMVSNIEFPDTYFDDEYLPYTTLKASDIYLENNRANIRFSQVYENNIYENNRQEFKELVVNETDISNILNNGTWSFPIPKKDTVFEIKRGSNFCNSLKIQNSKIKFEYSKYSYVDFETNIKSVCEGEKIIYNFKMTNEKLKDVFKIIPFINITYNLISAIDNKVVQNNIWRTIYNLEYQIDKNNNKITITIPNNIEELALNKIEKTAFKIQFVEFSLDIDAYGETPFIIKGNTYGLKVLLKTKPKLSFINSKDEFIYMGVNKIPVKFFGSNEIIYTLSNGQTGKLDQTGIVCNNNVCQQLTSGESAIQLFLEKSTKIKILKTENECGVSTVTSETNVLLKDSLKFSIEIDEMNLPITACKGTEIEIPFKINTNASSNIRFNTYINLIDERGGNQIINNIIEKSPFKFKVTNSYKYNKMEVWIKDLEGKIESKKIIFKINEKPNRYQIYMNDGFLSNYQNSEKFFYLEKDFPNISYESNGLDNKFKINGINYNSTQIGWWDPEYYSIYHSFQKVLRDTTFTINSTTNDCGTLEINEKISFEKVKTVLYNLNPANIYNYNPTNIKYTNCAGEIKSIEYEYYGEKPVKGNLIVQLAKNNNWDLSDKRNIRKMNFFDVITIPDDLNRLKIILPDTCNGTYYFRIRTSSGLPISGISINPFFNVFPKLKIKLKAENGLNEIVGNPSAKLILETNTYNNFWVKFSDDKVYNSNNLFNGENKSFQFSPTKTTTYTLKSAYNECGEANVEGSVKIIINPLIIPSLSGSEFTSTFCVADSVLLNLNYLGDFPKDTLMGVYLHHYNKPNYNIELSSFKNNPSYLSFKLPIDLNSSSYYYIQIRKKSRKNKYIPLVNQNDSIGINYAKLQWDSSTLPISVSAPPNLLFSGSNEIFEGETTSLILNSNNLIDQEANITNLIGTTYLELNNGEKLASTYSTIPVAPKETTTYSIKLVKNYCGVGKATGSPIVTVVNKTDKRIENLGFLRKYYDGKEYNTSYLNSCSGHKDSLDIKIFGASGLSDFSKFKVALSDKDGLNYRIIDTYKSQMVKDSSTYKILRLWHQIPENTTFGNNYRLKPISDGDSFASTPINYPLTINELPTATISGKVNFNKGDIVSTVVKFTGVPGWFLSVIDQSNIEVFNNFPTKKDSMEYFSNTKKTLESDFNIDFTPLKSNTYTIKSVANTTCGIGKVALGAFIVELLEPVLANELELEKLIKVFPNPTTEILKIDLKEINENVFIQLFDSAGQMIEQSLNEKEKLGKLKEINFAKSPKGVYLLNITSETFKQTYKIIKN